MTLAELRKSMKGESIVFGARETVKKMKVGEIKKIFLASNCPDKLRESIKYYAGIGKVDVEELDKDSSELALIAKRNHLVSVISY